jgi:hypothetical protein
LNDYVGTLVGVPELNTAWILDPYIGGATKNLAEETSPIATGNQVACEFNLVSRFYMMVSERDDKWMQEFMKKIIPGNDPETVSLEDYNEALLRYLATVDRDPSTRTLDGLTRGDDGTFDDTPLIDILTQSTNDCAGISHLGQLTCRGLQFRHS